MTGREPGRPGETPEAEGRPDVSPPTRPETATEKINREQAKLPNRGRPAEYDEPGDHD
ncbi:hypothetical protein [Aureimonas populi]|uniref:Uncharacterized protein n=1 Tax=Aureimonas populi TaxID=1701758 RepID=A0ABW5CK33_9HYPH|nr:hypothetical protein [Aureimonas populi]